MKKRLLPLLLSLLLLLTACHQKTTHQEFSLPEAFDTSTPVEISFWAKNDTNATQVEIYKQAIADFQALYPNITVNLKLYNDYGKIYDDVIKNLATDTAPNVCITYPDHIATYMTGENTVVPLDDLMSHPAYGLGAESLLFDSPSTEEIVPTFLEECKIGDTVYALPYMRSTEACYVNKTYVEQLGFTLPEILTWDFVWEVCNAALDKNEDGTFVLNGQKTLLPFIYKSTDNMMITYLKQSDAPYTKPDGTVELFNDTTSQFLTTIREETTLGAFSSFDYSGYPANFLNAGQCIFAIDSTGGATWMGADAPLLDIPEDKRVRFETVVMPVPQLDPAKPQMISQGPSMCIFNKENTQEVLASWLFMQFMLTNEVQIAYSQTEGYLPVTTKAWNDATYTDYISRRGEDNDLHYFVKIDAAKLLMDNIGNTFVTPVFNGSTSVRSAAGHLIDTVVKDARRKKPFDLAALYQDTTTLKRLDQIAITDPHTGAQTATLPELSDDLPPLSTALLWGLGITWLALALAYLLPKCKKKK